MASVQLRSRSAQERKQENGRRELQSKFESILNAKCDQADLRGKGGREAGQWREERQPRQPPSHRLHPAIQKVESIESMQLLPMKSAIHELQDLATPTSSHQPAEHRRIFRIHQTPQSFPLQQKPTSDYPPVSSLNKLQEEQNQLPQHYKEQIEKLKSQLGSERERSEGLTARIRKLEDRNADLEREVGLLIQKWGKEQANAEKVSGLQQDFKQQLLINLQLEELLLRQKLQLEKKEERKGEDAKGIIKELSQQLSEQKKTADREIQALKAAIAVKDKEISELRESLKAKEVKPQGGVTSLQELEPRTHSNFMERFNNFSKEMEAKLSQGQVVSTNPSLQDTAALELEANRKHSESEYSKGCPSVEIPLLEMKEALHRPASKTNRT